jgi:hypothetical protein
MTVCEFQVERFRARGSDDFLGDFAAYLDRMFVSGRELMHSDASDRR